MILFVCAEVLRPRQPKRIMSSAVSLSNHTFSGQAYSSKRLTSTVHILTPKNLQLSFLNQQKDENNRGNYFMINLHKRMLPTSVGVEPVISWSPIVRASNWATEASMWTMNEADALVDLSLRWVLKSEGGFSRCGSYWREHCLCWGFTAQSTQWGHVKHGQFT